MSKDLESAAREIIRLGEKATERPWEFRSTEHSGGIRFVVAPNGPRARNGCEFIAADCSHGYNGTFIAHTANHAVELAKSWLEMRAVLEAVHFYYGGDQHSGVAKRVATLLGKEGKDEQAD